jgi:hypothetical protein
MGRAIRNPDIRIATARYDFADLRSAASTVRDKVWSKGMNLLDINEAENRLDIGVANDKDQVTIESALRSAGIPSDMFRIQIGTMSVNAQTQIDSATQGALAGGVWVRNYNGAPGQSCSMGFTFQVIDWNTYTERPEYYGGIAAHCSMSPGSLDALPWSQPMGGRIIGYETLVPVPHMGGDCPGTDTCQFDFEVLHITDSAVAQPLAFQRGLVAWPTANDSSFTFSRYANIVWDLSVQTPSGIYGSVGHLWGRRESGTDGIKATCVTWKPTGGDYTYTCQNEAWFRSGHGDSGGIVYEATSDPNVVKLAGVVSGGHDYWYIQWDGTHHVHTTYYVPVGQIQGFILNAFPQTDLAAYSYNSEWNRYCVPNGPGNVNVTCQ